MMINLFLTNEIIYTDITLEIYSKYKFVLENSISYGYI